MARISRLIIIDLITTNLGASPMSLHLSVVQTITYPVPALLCPRPARRPPIHKSRPSPPLSQHSQRSSYLPIPPVSLSVAKMGIDTTPTDPNAPLAKKPISYLNLAIGAGLNIFEVSTLGQPFEVGRIDLIDDAVEIMQSDLQLIAYSVACLSYIGCQNAYGGKTWVGIAWLPLG